MQGIKDFTKEEDQRQNKDINELIEFQNRALKTSIDLRFEKIQENIDKQFLLLQKNLTLQFKAVIHEKKARNPNGNERKEVGNFIVRGKEQTSLEVFVSPRDKLGEAEEDRKGAMKNTVKEQRENVAKVRVGKEEEEMQEKVPPIVPKLNFGGNTKGKLFEVKSDSNSHLWDEDSDEIINKKRKIQKSKKKIELEVRPSDFSDDDSVSTPRRQGGKKADINQSQRNIKRPSHATTSKQYGNLVQMKRSGTMEVSGSRERQKGKLKLNKKKDLRMIGAAKEQLRKASWEEAPLETEEDRLKQDTAREMDI